MKHLTSLLFFIIILLGLTASTFKASPLVGKWRGEDGGEVGTITFDKKGYVSFSINNQEIGGKEYLSEGVLYDMTYAYDHRQNPKTLDFIIQNNEDKIEIARMRGIYKLLDKDILIINMKFDGSERPIIFDDQSDDQIALTRIK